MVDYLLLESGDQLLLETLDGLILEDWFPGLEPGLGADTGVATAFILSIGSAVGRDFSTITAWEAFSSVNLPNSNAIVIGECYDDSDFNEAVTISGATVDPGHYRVLRAAAGQEYNPRTGTGVRIFHAVSTPITISEASFVLQGVLCEFTGAGNDGICVSIGASGVRLERVVAKQTAATAAVAGGGFVCTTAQTWFARYCLSIGSETNDLGMNYGFHQNHASAVCLLENCVAYSSRLTATSRGFLNTAGTMTARACIGSNNRGSDFQGVIGQSYNLSSDATATGTGSYTLLTTAQTFKAASSQDFRPIRTSPAVDGGVYVVPSKPHTPHLINDRQERIASHFANGADLAVGDISGNAYDGEIQGAPTWVSREIGPALAFTAGGDHVTYPTAAGVTRTGPDHTIQIWFQRTAHATANQTLWSEVGGVNTIYKLVLVDASATTRVQLFVRNSAGTTLLNTTTPTFPITTNVIHQIIVTDDNGVVTLYVDGVSVHTASYTRPTDLGEALTPSIARIHSTDNQFIGRVYDYRAWPIILDLTRIILCYAPNPWKEYGGTDPIDLEGTKLWVITRFDIGVAEWLYEPMPWHGDLNYNEFTFSVPIVGAAAATSITIPLWHPPDVVSYLRLEHLHLSFDATNTPDSIEIFWKLGGTESSLVTKTADWQGSLMVQVSPSPGSALWARVARAAGTPTARIMGSGICTR